MVDLFLGKKGRSKTKDNFMTPSQVFHVVSFFHVCLFVRSLVYRQVADLSVQKKKSSINCFFQGNRPINCIVRNATQYIDRIGVKLYAVSVF